MVYDHPGLALFHEREAITRWQRLGFAVLYIRERVVAGVDSCAAINADQLLAECDLETGQDLERRDEVVAQRCSIRSQGRRESSPENSISGIEKNNFVRIVLPQSLGPFHGRSGNVLLRPGRGDRCSHANEYKQQSRSPSPESHASSSSSIKQSHNIQSCRHGPGLAERAGDFTPIVNPAHRHFRSPNGLRLSGARKVVRCSRGLGNRLLLVIKAKTKRAFPGQASRESPPPRARRRRSAFGSSALARTSPATRRPPKRR